MQDYGAAKSRFRSSKVEGLRFRFLELLNGRIYARQKSNGSENPV